MHSKRENSKQKSSQKRLKSSSLFSQCQKVISELQGQLQHALRINQEKDQMIKMLTQEKQFYMNQAKISSEKKYTEMKQQINWNNSLIAGLKKHNKQIADKYQSLLNQNTHLTEQLKFKEELLNTQSIEIEKIKIQKGKIQSQWNRTLLSVKQKIIQLYRSSQTKNQNQKKATTKNQKFNEKLLQKQQNNIKQSGQIKSLSNKVEHILSELNQKIISYQIQDLIKSQYFQTKVNLKPVMNQANINMKEIGIDEKLESDFKIKDISNFIENKENFYISSNL